MQGCHNNTDRTIDHDAHLAHLDAAYDVVRKKKRWDTVRIFHGGALCFAKDKTRIAKMAKGFNFLGYCIAESGIAVSMSTGKRFRARLLRLHEQRGGLLPLKQYIRHWVRWATAGAAVEKLQLLQKKHTILHFISIHCGKGLRS